MSQYPVTSLHTGRSTGQGAWSSQSPLVLQSWGRLSAVQRAPRGEQLTHPPLRQANTQASLAGCHRPPTHLSILSVSEAMQRGALVSVHPPSPSPPASRSALSPASTGCERQALEKQRNAGGHSRSTVHAIIPSTKVGGAPHAAAARAATRNAAGATLRA